MKCPTCNTQISCKDSRDDPSGLRWRRYICSCGLTIKTHEKIIETYQGQKTPGREKIVRLEPKSKLPIQQLVVEKSTSMEGYEESMKYSTQRIRRILEEREEKKINNNVVEMKHSNRPKKAKDKLRLIETDKDHREKDIINRDQIKKNMEARHKLEDMKVDKELSFVDEFEYSDNDGID